MPVNANTFEGAHISAKTATIASSGTKSDAIELHGCSLAAIETPAAFTGTTISFEGSIDGSTYVPIHDKNGTLVYIATVTTSRAYALDPTIFHAFRYIKIVSGSSEGAERAIKCSLVILQ